MGKGSRWIWGSSANRRNRRFCQHSQGNDRPDHHIVDADVVFTDATDDIEDDLIDVGTTDIDGPAEFVLK